MAKFANKPESAAPEKRRGPIVCAFPTCPRHGSISESVQHESSEHTKWYCKAHWGVRAPDQYLERMGVVKEMDAGLHPPPGQHWEDKECEYRMKEMGPKDVAAARALLRALTGARDPSEVHAEREVTRRRSLIRSERERGDA